MKIGWELAENWVKVEILFCLGWQSPSVKLSWGTVDLGNQQDYDWCYFGKSPIRSCWHAFFHLSFPLHIWKWQNNISFLGDDILFFPWMLSMLFMLQWNQPNRKLPQFAGLILVCHLAAIFQTFSNAFLWIKMYGFWLKFHWSLFLRF